MHRPSALLLTLLLAACGSLPVPQETLVEFQTEAGLRYGTSTEGGLLVLSELLDEKEQVPFRYRVGNGFFDDVATVVTRGDHLSVLSPVSSQLNQARFARSPVLPDEPVLLESRSEEGEPEFIPLRLYRGGAFGDLLIDEEEDRTAAELAAAHSGAGVFVERDGFLQLVGIVNGVYVPAHNSLAFISADALSDVLPNAATFLERIALPMRADFEYGVPREFQGERPHASGVQVSNQADSEADSTPPPALDFVPDPERE